MSKPTRNARRTVAFVSTAEQIETSRAYVAGLSSAARARAAHCLILSCVRSSEQTDSYVKSCYELRGFDVDTYEAAVGELLDAGLVRATVIDGRDLGFLAGLHTV